MSSGLVIGLIIALVLNAVFRIGMSSRATVEIPPGRARTTRCAASSSSRAPSGARAATSRAGDLRHRTGGGEHRRALQRAGAVTLEAAFDEFNLDIRLSWQGDDF